MIYRFEIPKNIKLDDPRRTMIIHGGMCPSKSVIYLYGFNNTETEDAQAATFYTWILNHEHLHAVLHTLGVPLKFHEIIIDKMSTYSCS